MLLIVVCYHLLSAARPTPVNNKPIAAGTATDIKTNPVNVRSTPPATFSRSSSQISSSSPFAAAFNFSSTIFLIAISSSTE